MPPDIENKISHRAIYSGVHKQQSYAPWLLHQQLYRFFRTRGEEKKTEGVAWRC
jgi:hypothetical protein